MQYTHIRSSLSVNLDIFVYSRLVLGSWLDNSLCSLWNKLYYYAFLVSTYGLEDVFWWDYFFHTVRRMCIMYVWVVHVLCIFITCKSLRFSLRVTLGDALCRPVPLPCPDSPAGEGGNSARCYGRHQVLHHASVGQTGPLPGVGWRSPADLLLCGHGLGGHHHHGVLQQVQQQRLQVSSSTGLADWSKSRFLFACNFNDKA